MYERWGYLGYRELIVAMLDAERRLADTGVPILDEDPPVHFLAHLRQVERLFQIRQRLLKLALLNSIDTFLSPNLPA